MRVSAKAEYAVRAAIELAASDGEHPVKKSVIVEAQKIPPKFLENILAELRHAGLVESQRGADGGYWLTKPAAEISVADVMRAVEGPLASVRSQRPEALEYEGVAEPLQKVWVALRASIRDVLESTSLEQLVSGEPPADLLAIVEPPEAWASPVAQPREVRQAPARAFSNQPPHTAPGLESRDSSANSDGVGHDAPSSSSSGRRCISAASACRGVRAIATGIATAPASARSGSASANIFNSPV